MCPLLAKSWKKSDSSEGFGSKMPTLRFHQDCVQVFFSELDCIAVWTRQSEQHDTDFEFRPDVVDTPIEGSYTYVQIKY